MRKTEAFCVSKEKFKNKLLAGRFCVHDSQCYQRNCTQGICVGKSQGSSCAAHEECGVGLACRHQLEWPYNTFCLPLLKKGEDCMDDHECEMD